jgi:hypothetical protein
VSGWSARSAVRNPTQQCSNSGKTVKKIEEKAANGDKTADVFEIKGKSRK